MARKRRLTIQESFQRLRQNYTPANVIAFIDDLRTRPLEEILENSMYILVEPTKGVDFLMEIINTNTLSYNQLREELGKTARYLRKCMDQQYENKEHMEKIQEYLARIVEVGDKMVTNEYLRESAIVHLRKKYEPILNNTVLEGIGEMEPIVGAEEENDDCACIDPRELELAFAIGFIETFLDDNEEVNMESFNKMVSAWYQYEKVMEGPDGIHGVMRKAALKAEDASRKFAHGLRKMGAESRRVKAVAKRIPRHIDNLINNTLGKIRDMDHEERRKRIIEGGYKVKLLKIIRNAILIGGTALIHPALAAIGLLTAIAVDKRQDKRVRNQILNELENELKIVNEKIEDAKGDTDKQKKYQLMRIKHKLENDIKRIQFRLDE